ncbi:MULTISPECIES: non-homologous end-joining DNA ligase [Nonomuraea]|uniref:DNA ligase (ATP) n=1 Tax=Nonomuraea ferruginea TaxID=46174 RepID=A0ABT4T2D1_9ACTN|nr:non-homologous end-joining DNA ligase [Nonomuraea ferruginea]MDA0643574.1 non-homologous end-joining DNA ligase [Nonomuraea ferruginea]
MGDLPEYSPMLARLGRLPPSAEDRLFGYEMKWDGARTVGYVDGAALRLFSRNGLDVTAAYPELGPLPTAVRGRAVLDGEIVALDHRGVPSFTALQPRIHQRDPSRVAALARSTPVSYLIFDVLHVDDFSTIDLPYAERRELLSTTVAAGERWSVPPHSVGDGAAAFRRSRERLLEGVVAKRLASTYEPGRRSRHWVKVKNFRTQEVIVGGWRPGEGRRADMIGSLLLGVYDDSGRLIYVGNVGTGFTDAMLRDLAARLAPYERPDSPFDEELPRPHERDARWVAPVLVGEVQYTEWTADGRLRHPSWRGLRPDKRPDQVRKEED